jgi:hypothetical protein
VLGQIDATCVDYFVIGATPVEASPSSAGALELDAIDDGLALVPAGAALVLTVASRPEHTAFAVHHAIAQHLALARGDEHERAVREGVSTSESGICSFRPRRDVSRDSDDDDDRRESEENFFLHPPLDADEAARVAAAYR